MSRVCKARYQKKEIAYLSLFFFKDMFVSFLPQGIFFLLFLAGICHCLGLCLAGSGCDCLGVFTLELLWHSNSCSSATNQSDWNTKHTYKLIISLRLQHWTWHNGTHNLIIDKGSLAHSKRLLSSFLFFSIMGIPEELKHLIYLHCFLILSGLDLPETIM